MWFILGKDFALVLVSTVWYPGIHAFRDKKDGHLSIIVMDTPVALRRLEENEFGTTGLHLTFVIQGGIATSVEMESEGRKFRAVREAARALPKSSTERGGLSEASGHGRKTNPEPQSHEMPASAHLVQDPPAFL